MSGSFSGFSEEDIKNLSNKKSYEAQKIATGTKIGLQERRTNDRIQKQMTATNHKILNKKIKNSFMESIPETAKLSMDLNDKIKEIKSQQNDNNDSKSNKQEVEEVKEVLVSNTNSSEVNEKENTNETEVPERKLDLAHFQERQKLIEEQNKRRKELLTKALAVRTQKTKEEVQKLDAIREEFKKLDLLLSGDVKILRQQIEMASLEYMEAEKRYFRVEKDFLNAKLMLHQKSERKEMLTEHLCAVIEKNEERKAEKLDELINKLNLKSDFQDKATTNPDSSILKN